MPHTKDVLATFGQHHRNPVKVITRPIAKINHKEAMQIALGVVPGEVNAVHIERKAGKNVYTVEIIGEADGVEMDVFVDIESGDIVGTDR